MKTVTDIRINLLNEYERRNFVKDKTGCRLVEIICATFKCTDNTIFGAVNTDYISREIDWYNSCSLNVRDIEGKVPKIWQDVSTKDGFINSNYGWCIFSHANFDQYESVKKTLSEDPLSRRAVMIYTRPNMQQQYCQHGMSDFMCTNTVQYFIRKDKLCALVQMRSNDAWAGYRNDYAWQLYVLNKLSKDLNVESGDIIWNVGSLHLYERQFYLLDHFEKTGQVRITKKDYDELQMAT